jgi:Predicted membrane-associated Zn-dependent proteases 1
MPKIRMFGAGITNNIVIGVVCFLLMILLVGMAVPTSQPVIQGVYQNYSAQQAGIPAYSVITGINGVPVATIDQVSAMLNQTSPGDTIALTVSNQGTAGTYNLTLTSWPEELGERNSGFMGVYYYSGSAVIGAVQNSASPLGFLMLLTVPFNMSGDGQFLRILAFDTPATQFYSVPFGQFWVLVNVLFWSGWININLGIFNAIPMVPLDGGYILKEGVERVLDRKGLIRYAQPIVSVISTFMIVMLISLVALPYLLHL